jgi:non-ribosomal peptide synthetase component F/acyl carrier protein
MFSFNPITLAETAQSIPSRFEEQAMKYGKQLAVKTQNQALTYEELNQFANRIASDLLSRKIPSPSPIVILCEQGTSFIAATLGVLKAGLFYVPLAPTDSPAYLLEIVQGLQSPVIISDSNYADSCSKLVQPDQSLINIEELNSDLSLENPNLQIDPDSLAYIYFTSGSTGRPKGVTDTHRNVLHNILRYTNSLKITHEDKLTLLHSPSLSACVSSQFGALLNGASLFPYRINEESIDTLASWLITEEITIYHSIPLIFRFALNELSVKSSLRTIRLEGDEAAIQDLEFFIKFGPDNCILVNGLGTSETGLCRQFFFDKHTKLPTTTVPIGYPVEDMDVFVVDEEGHQVVTNQPGEIAVRSRFLSPGYWNDSERTIKAFSNDPHHNGVRIYKTGDLGRMKEDRCLEYLGRITPVIDFQQPTRLTIRDQTIKGIETRSATEQVLATLWANILNTESISSEDDLFSLGGDSIKAMRLVNLVNQEFETQISIKDLFSNPVLSDFAKFVESHTDSRTK